MDTGKNLDYSPFKFQTKKLLTDKPQIFMFCVQYLHEELMDSKIYKNILVFILVLLLFQSSQAQETNQFNEYIGIFSNSVYGNYKVIIEAQNGKMFGSDPRGRSEIIQEMDDLGGLLPIEKKATIGHLISARSGVYHVASYKLLAALVTSLQTMQPPEGFTRNAFDAVIVRLTLGEGWHRIIGLHIFVDFVVLYFILISSGKPKKLISESSEKQEKSTGIAS